MNGGVVLGGGGLYTKITTCKLNSAGEIYVITRHSDNLL